MQSSTHISTTERALVTSATSGNDVIVSATAQWSDVSAHVQVAGQSSEACVVAFRNCEEFDAHAP